MRLESLSLWNLQKGYWAMDRQKLINRKRKLQQEMRELFEHIKETSDVQSDSYQKKVQAYKEKKEEVNHINHQLYSPSKG